MLEGEDLQDERSFSKSPAAGTHVSVTKVTTRKQGHDPKVKHLGECSVFASVWRVKTQIWNSQNTNVKA